MKLVSSLASSTTERRRGGLGAWIDHAARVEHIVDPIDAQLARPLARLLAACVALPVPVLAFFFVLADSGLSTLLLLAGPIAALVGAGLGFLALRSGAVALAANLLSWSIVLAGCIHMVHFGHPDNQPFVSLFVLAIVLSTVLGQPGTAITQTITALVITTVEMLVKLEHAQHWLLPPPAIDPTVLTWPAFGATLPLITAALVVFTTQLRAALRRSIDDRQDAEAARARIAEEIERSRQANALVAERTDELDAITQAAELLLASRDENEASGVLSELLARLFRGGICRLYRIEDDQARLLATSFPTAGDERPFRSGECWAIRRGVVHEAGGETGTVQCGHVTMNTGGEDGVESLCVPLVGFGSLQGLLSWIAYAPDDATRAREHRRIRVVSEQLSLALANLALRGRSG